MSRRLFGGIDIHRELIALGAESRIERVLLWDNWYVLKTRPSKQYLLCQIDAHLRKSRTSRECKVLNIARSLGVRTPTIHSIDLKHYSLLMDYIEGVQLKEIVEKVSNSQLKDLCYQFGILLAHLHQGGVVHGDPTTSNVLRDYQDRLWMIDFGLSDLNATVEMKGVDLHLVHRAFETTHWNHQDEMLEATYEGYLSVGAKDAEEVLNRMKVIRERGRYH